MKKHFHMMKTQGGENFQAQASAPNSDAHRRNCIYDPRPRSGQLSALFSFDVYILFDPGATL